MRGARGGGINRQNTRVTPPNNSSVPVQLNRTRGQRTTNIPRHPPTEKKTQLLSSETPRKTSSFSLCCCCGSNKRNVESNGYDKNETPGQYSMQPDTKPQNEQGNPHEQTVVVINVNGKSPVTINKNHVQPDEEVQSSYPDPIHSVRISPSDLVTPRLQSLMIS